MIHINIVLIFSLQADVREEMGGLIEYHVVLQNLLVLVLFHSSIFVQFYCNPKFYQVYLLYTNCKYVLPSLESYEDTCFLL